MTVLGQQSFEGLLMFCLYFFRDDSKEDFAILDFTFKFSEYIPRNDETNKNAKGSKYNEIIFLRGDFSLICIHCHQIIFDEFAEDKLSVGDETIVAILLFDAILVCYSKIFFYLLSHDVESQRRDVGILKTNWIGDQHANIRSQSI